MGVVFPLSPAGRVVLIIIAIVIGLIWSMLMWPNWWKKVFGKSTDQPQVVVNGKAKEEKK